MDAFAFILFLFVLIVAPIFFGAVHTYAYTFVFLVILVGFSAVFFHRIQKDHQKCRYFFRLPVSPITKFFIVMTLYIFFQMLPMPADVVRFLSLERLTVHQMAQPIAINKIQSAASQWFSAAVYHYPVRMSCVRFIVYGLFFFGLTETLTSRRRIEIAVFIIIILCACEAIYGLSQLTSASRYVLWYKRPANWMFRTLSGTYINPNHYAGLLEMGFVLAMAYMLALAAGDSRSTRRLSHRVSRFRRFVLWVVDNENRLNKMLMMMVPAIVIFVAILFSGSRGALISVGATIVFLITMLSLKSSRSKARILLLIICLVAVLCSAMLNIETTMNKFRSILEGFRDRQHLTMTTLEIYKDYPWAGVGIGNFQYVFPRYQSVMHKEKFYEWAHNDWAQFLAEAGSGGMVILVSGVIGYLMYIFRIWRQRRDSFAKVMGLAVPAVMLAMAVHSLGEFNLHIPANFLVMTAIIAVGHAALHIESGWRNQKIRYHYMELALKGRGGIIVIVTAGLIFWSGTWSMRHFMAETFCNTVKNSTLNRDPLPPLADIRKAIEWDSGNAQYHYKLAKALDERRSIKTDDGFRESMTRDMIRALKTALTLNPYEFRYHYMLARQYTYFWNQSDFRETCLPTADAYMKHAAYFSGEKSANIHLDMGYYWVWRSKLLTAEDTDQMIFLERARHHFKMARYIGLDHAQEKRMVQTVERFYHPSDPAHRMVF